MPGLPGRSATMGVHLSAMASQKGRRAARGAGPGTAPMPPDLAKQKVSRKKTSMAASDRYDSSTMARKVSTPTARNCLTAALRESASRMAAMLWHRGSTLTCKQAQGAGDKLSYMGGKLSAAGVGAHEETHDPTAPDQCVQRAMNNSTSEIQPAGVPLKESARGGKLDSLLP